MEDLTLFSLSQQVYTDLVSATTHELLVEALLNELLTRQEHGPLQHGPTPSPAHTPLQLPNGINSQQVSRQPTPSIELQIRQDWIQVNGRDVFGQEKVPDSSRYFSCVQCSRRIAGNRFAIHLDRCLGGRGRK